MPMPGPHPPPRQRASAGDVLKAETAMVAAAANANNVRFMILSFPVFPESSN
jgi:hypothetical protein